MTLHAKIGTTWRTINQAYVKVAGVWRAATVYNKVNGVWRVSSNTVGQAQWTTAGTYSFTVPGGVTSICAVCIGGHQALGSSTKTGGVGGGALAYSNDIPVTPGENLTITVTMNGGTRIQRGGATLVYADFGRLGSALRNGGIGGSITNSVGQVRRAGGNGGVGAQPSDGDESGGGGGGAAGYTSNGGTGLSANFADDSNGGGGGGVGIFGGTVGGQGGGAERVGTSSAIPYGGAGGSGGTNGSPGDGAHGVGGLFGGGHGGTNGRGSGYLGAAGACRIIWGLGRAFPNTNTQNMTN